MARSSFGLGFMFTAKDTATPVMSSVGNSFKKMDKAAEKSTRRMKASTPVMKAATQNIKQVGAATSSTTQKMNIAAPAIKKVTEKYKQLDKAVDKSARRMQAAQGAMSVGIGVLAVGAAGLAVTLKSALAAGDFEQGVAKVGAISGATGKQLEELSAKAIQAGLDTQFSPKEAIGGLAELTVRGLTAGEAMFALDGALSLAAGGQISIAQASSTTASALKVFGLEADQAGFAADKLLKISNVTALQANDLELALGTVGRGASLAKQSIDEMLPSIGLVKNTGVDASTAASSVSSALIFMAKNAKKFTKLGVAVTDADGKFRPFMDIVLDTQGAMAGMGNEAEKAAKAQELFGRFGVSAFTAIANQTEKGIRKPTGEIVKGAEAVEFLRESMRGAAGTAKKFADALLNTLPGQIVLLKGSMETLAIVLGRPLAEAFKPAVSAIKEGINSLIGFVQSMSPGMKKFLVIAVGVGSGLLSLGGIMLVLGATAAIAGPAILTFFGFIAASAGPIALVGLAIAGLIGGLVFLRKAYKENIGGFADFVGPKLAAVKLFFGALFQFIEDGFFSGDTARKLADPKNAPVMKLLVGIITTGNRVQKFFFGFVGGLKVGLNSLGPAFEIIKIAFKAILGLGLKVVELFAGPWKTHSNEATKAGHSFGIAIFFAGTALLAFKSRLIVARVAVFAFNALLVVARGVVLAFKGAIMAVRAAIWLMTLATNAQRRAQVLWVGIQVIATAGAWALRLVIIADTAARWLWTAAVAAAKTVGWLFTAMMSAQGRAGIILQAVLVGARVKILAFAAAQKIAALASGSLKLSTMGLMGKAGMAGMVLAAGAAGFAIGTYIDDATGASTAIADWLANLTGLNAELKAQDELLHGGTTNVRTQAKFLGELDPNARAEALKVPGSVAFNNNTTGAAEATASAAGEGGLSADAVKEGVMAAMAESKRDSKQTKITTIVQIDGETIDKREKDAALDFGGDFFGDD